MSEDSSKDKVKINKPQTLGGPLRVIFTLLASLLLSQALAFLSLSFLLKLGGSQTSPQDINNVPAFEQFVFVLISEAAAIGFIYLFLRRRRMNLRNIGLDRRPVWSDLWTSLLGFGLFYAFLIAITVAIKIFLPAVDIDQPQEVGFETLHTSVDRVLAFISLVLLAPIGEEILWRGYLFSGLRFRYKFLPTLVITSLIFGALHLEFGGDEPLNWMAGIATLLLAVILAYAREKSKALYSPLAIHSMNNAVAFAVVFL